MKKILSLLAGFSALFMVAQDVDFGSYTGTNTNPSTTKAASEDLTVRFEDGDIINDFYTENQTVIYAYVCYRNDTGGFQNCVGNFNDVVNTMLPVNLTAADGDASVGPNEYEFTFNPQGHMNIPNGTQVTALDIIFVNQFAGGGNNQTIDLSIDVDDRNLGISDIGKINAEKSVFASNRLVVAAAGDYAITVYNLNGQVVKTQNVKNMQTNQTIDLQLDRGNYIIQTQHNGKVENIKALVQ